jgi:DNA-binding MarR family transcriptional regulator
MIEILESFGRVKRAANLLAVQELKPLGLGSKQASMLHYLASHRGCSHADLARHTITDPAATGRIADALIRRGLVVQTEHPHDRRRWMLALSPQGRHLAEKIEAVYEGVAAVLVLPLSKAERLDLIASLDKISGSLALKPKTKPKKESP